MIKAKFVCDDEGNFLELDISGHSNYDEYGKDIVCAGVSSIFIGGLNALNSTDYKIEISEGLGNVVRTGKLDTHDKIVFDVMKIQLETIEETYGKYLKIESN